VPDKISAEDLAVCFRGKVSNTRASTASVTPPDTPRQLPGDQDRSRGTSKPRQDPGTTNLLNVMLLCNVHCALLHDSIQRQIYHKFCICKISNIVKSRNIIFSCIFTKNNFGHGSAKILVGAHLLPLPWGCPSYTTDANGNDLMILVSVH